MSQDLLQKSLRKAWLKQRFSSWAYHEELLALHDQYLTAMHKHWSNPEIQKAYPDDHASMKSPVFTNLDRVQKPGEITKAEWESNPTVGWADAISYNFNRGFDFVGCNEYAGMSDAERERLNALVGEMLDHCTNIKITVEDRWDDANDEILNEKYTGRIHWPAHWQEDLFEGATALTRGLGGVQAKAGDPAPRSGTWQALDVSGERRHIQAGDPLPNLRSAYGLTIWQLVPDND